MLRFFLEKFFDACHANSCFRYHKYYPVLHEDNTKKFAIFLFWLSEVESSRTLLASRTHFEVLGLGFVGQVLGFGLEASSPRKLPCPRLEDSTLFFEQLKFCWNRHKPRGKFANTFFVFLNRSIDVAKEGGRGTKEPSPAPNWIFTYDKNVPKSLLFLQFQFLFSIFRLQQ